MRHQAVLTDGMVAEEGLPPGALGVFLPGAFAAAAAVAGTVEPVAGTELIEGEGSGNSWKWTSRALTAELSITRRLTW